MECASCLQKQVPKFRQEILNIIPLRVWPTKISYPCSVLHIFNGAIIAKTKAERNEKLAVSAYADRFKRLNTWNQAGDRAMHSLRLQFFPTDVADEVDFMPRKFFPKANWQLALY